jgi:hypothetical protein
VALSAPSSETNADGDTVYLPLAATDSAGNALNWSATGLPAGLSISATTGFVSGIISAGADVDSPYTVTVTATHSVDADGTASQTIDWTVNSTGTITVSLTQPANQTNYEQDSVSLAVSATDSASNALVYTATNLPVGLAINESTGAISGTVSNGDAANSPYTVTVTVADSTNPDVGASQTFQGTVNPNPVTVSVPRFENNLGGDTVSLDLTGTDLAGTLSWSATGLPGGLSMATDGAISGTITGRRAIIR